MGSLYFWSPASFPYLECPCRGGPCMYKHTDVYADTSRRHVLFCTLLFSLILGIYSVLIPVELLYVFPSLI